MAAVFTEIRRSRIVRKCRGGCGHPIQEGELYERTAIPPGEFSDHWYVSAQHIGEEYMQGQLRPGEYQAPDEPW
jgi:hypothetical protein